MKSIKFFPHTDEILRGYYYICADGDSDMDARCTKQGKYWHAHINSTSVRKKLCSATFRRIAMRISLLSYDSDHGIVICPGMEPVCPQVFVYLRPESSCEETGILFIFAVWAGDWKGVYSPADLATAAEGAVKKLGISGVEYSRYEGEDDVGFALYYPLHNMSEVMSEFLEKCADISSRVIAEAVDGVMSGINDESLVLYFRFPENIRAACIQYISYFAQFLRDLGVDASSEMKDGPDQFALSVVPRDRNEGLMKIREALSVYLSLPYNNSLDTSLLLKGDFAKRQLYEVINQLSSQIKLIQDIAVERETAVLATDKPLSAREGSSMAASAPVCFLGGAIEISQFKIGPVKIDAAKILRLLDNMRRK